MAERKCSECGWHKQIDQKNQTNGSPQGKCLAKSPSVSAVVMPVVNKFSREVTPQIIEVTSWPTTQCNADACGDFEPGLTLKTTKEEFE